jgi:FtsP/CotA-like multicopper oxidase with cupredoxin domain
MKRTSIVQAILLTALTAANCFAAPVPGGTLDPTSIPKYDAALPLPGVMPKASTTKTTDYYQIAARQFQQQILPAGLPMTTVWGYGAVADKTTFQYPARTIEAQVNRPVQVQWQNDLVDGGGRYLPHILPIDQTLDWANPAGLDCKDGKNLAVCQSPYTGPVPMVAHLHGAHVLPDSDGFPLGWFLPNATNIPAGYATKGDHYQQIPGAPQAAGQATYRYPNDQRSTTLWYHDHTMGITRANVYTGLAGLYLLRSPSDPAGLPKGAYEIPLVFQDKSFNSDGSLFFPSNRAFFEGVTPAQLQIPFIPEQANGGMSDVPPIWNPEFFGNVMVVNGKAWPKLNAEARRYRLRLLNGDDTRVLIFKIAKDPVARPGTPVVPFWQIGADGGFLPKPVQLNELLLAPGERADVIVDLSAFPNTDLFLINEGPDEPFGGGRAPTAFAFADPGTTGQIMKIAVGTKPASDPSTDPTKLTLTARTPLGAATNVRTVSLNEAESATVPVVYNADGSIVYDPTNNKAVPFAPVMAMLGTASVSKGVITPTPNMYMDPITETPALGSTEIWEIYDFTADAHPIHIHQVQFEVINRQALKIAANGTATLSGNPLPPEAGETGTKDTVLVYPGMMTRVKAKFDLPGLYIWHCHILSHEDNDMMRPICVGPSSGCN